MDACSPAAELARPAEEEHLCAVSPAAAGLKWSAGRALLKTSGRDLLQFLRTVWAPAASWKVDLNPRPAAFEPCLRRAPVTGTESRPRKRSGKENYLDGPLR